MKLDPIIGKQIEASKDKAKNPFKYHFLKLKKNLSDVEIFEKYNGFNFHSDPNEMGHVYLNQLKSLNKQLKQKINKSNSTGNVKTE